MNPETRLADLRDEDTALAHRLRDLEGATHGGALDRLRLEVDSADVAP